MITQILKGFGFLACAGILTLTPAYAVDVNFTTTGSLTCSSAGYSCSGNTLTGPNSVQLQYTLENGSDGPYDVGPGSANSSNVYFGYFEASGNPPSGDLDTLPNTTFDLTITQTLGPAPGDAGLEASLQGTISGVIQHNNSGAELVFSASSNVTGNVSDVNYSAVDPTDNKAAISFNLGAETYYIDDLDKIAKAASNGSDGPESPVVGAVTSSAPEPSFYAFVGIGLAGLFAAVNRRKKQTVA